MKTIKPILRYILGGLTGFLALTAILGGIALMADFNAPPVTQLEGTIFNSFFIPGATLAIITGGIALLSTILLLKKNKYSILSSLTSGIIIMFFEFAEVMIIGSPQGYARVLQIVYFSIGTIIAVISVIMWYIDIKGSEE